MMNNDPLEDHESFVRLKGVILPFGQVSICLFKSIKSVKNEENGIGKKGAKKVLSAATLCPGANRHALGSRDPS